MWRLPARSMVVVVMECEARISHLGDGKEIIRWHPSIGSA